MDNLTNEFFKHYIDSLLDKFKKLDEYVNKVEARLEALLEKTDSKLEALTPVVSQVQVIEERLSQLKDDVEQMRKAFEECRSSKGDYALTVQRLESEGKSRNDFIESFKKNRDSIWTKVVAGVIAMLLGGIGGAIISYFSQGGQ